MSFKISYSPEIGERYYMKDLAREQVIIVEKVQVDSIKVQIEIIITNSIHLNKQINRWLKLR